MSYRSLKCLIQKKFLISIFLHILHGFLFEKSKLYYPYTFNRNILLIKTDLFKYYLSACFVFLGMPFALSKIWPEKYLTARTTTEKRYQNRNSVELQIGSYLSGLAIVLIGVCPSYLPFYLATSPVLFLFSTAASYAGYILYHFLGGLFFHRLRTKSINAENNNTSSVSGEKIVLYNIGRIILLSVGIVILLVFETGDQSVSPGHNVDELLDLIQSGDYLPPGLTGLLCGLIDFCLIFLCDEYETLTSEWLLNIFYYTSELSTDSTQISGDICFQQILKILAISFGARASLWTSKRREVPIVDWLFYSIVGCGSMFSAFGICLTTAAFTEHIYFITAFVGSISSNVISWTIGSAWFLLYSTKLTGL